MISIADLGLGAGIGCIVGLALNNYLKGLFGKAGEIDANSSRIEQLAAKAFREAFESEAGKRLASRQDVDNVLSEVRNVTRETESIKAQISGEAWLKQTVWMQKRNAYGELLKATSSVQFTSFYLNRHFRQRQGGQARSGSEQPTTNQSEVGRFRSELVDRIITVADRFAEAELFDPSLAKMKQEFRNMKGIFEIAKTVGDGEKHVETAKVLTRFQRQLLRHMRRGLNIDDAAVDQGQVVSQPASNDRTLKEASAAHSGASVQEQVTATGTGDASQS